MFKSLIQKTYLIIILSVFSFSFSHAKDDYRVESQVIVLEKALQMEPFGLLKQKENGYLYVDVSNDFIAEILPLIEAPGKLVPPSDYTNKKGIGAHISVIYEQELIENEIWHIQELENVFTFQVKELRTVKLNKNGKTKKLWLLAVDAPDLENLRLSYGLAPKLKGHDFHITLGYQIPGNACIYGLGEHSNYWLISEEDGDEWDNSGDELSVYPAAA